MENKGKYIQEYKLIKKNLIKADHSAFSGLYRRTKRNKERFGRF